MIGSQRFRRHLLFLFFGAIALHLLPAGGASEKDPAPSQNEQAPPASGTGQSELQISGAESTPSSNEEYRALLTDILRVLDDLILSGPPEGEVRAIYSMVRIAMNEDRVQLALGNEDLDRLQSVYFSADGSADQPGYLVIAPSYFELLSSQPSLALSLMVEAMGHAANFLRLGEEFGARYDEALDLYLFSMDALYLQTLFVDQYLASSYHLSPFEEYLLESLTVDNLSSVSLFFRGVDQDIVYSLLEQSQAVRQGRLSLNDFLRRVEELVALLSSQYQDLFSMPIAPSEPGTDDAEFLERSRYITTVSTGSYLKYGVWVINLLFSEMQPEIQGSESLSSSVRQLNESSAQLYQLFLDASYDVLPYRESFISNFF